ncbi:MAG: ABC transporter substrate-binding protein [Pseudomonadales bacterium]|nr:ABC transporter substrate-binding protein [Pseudomonadales bacterium]
MKRLTIRIITGAFLLLSCTAQVLANLNPAEEAVQKTTVDMLALIEEAKSYVDVDRERFFAEVEDLLTPAVDFERFARSVMAVHYRKATAEQRVRFADSFKKTLVRTYAVALTEFDDGEVVIVPSNRPPSKPDQANVKQEIRLAGGDVYPVIYSMARTGDGTWLMRNIIVNGVNMGLTYRNQFASAASDSKYGGDMDRIIDGWIESVGQVAVTEVAATEASVD